MDLGGAVGAGWITAVASLGSSISIVGSGDADGGGSGIRVGWETVGTAVGVVWQDRINPRHNTAGTARIEYRRRAIMALMANLNTFTIFQFYRLGFKAGYSGKPESILKVLEKTEISNLQCAANEGLRPIAS
jgi:hypothetical protein